MLTARPLLIHAVAETLFLGRHLGQAAGMLGVDRAVRRAALHDLGDLGDGFEGLAFDGGQCQAGHVRRRHHVAASRQVR